jgi:peptide/nickel transport system substrate-binding protein
MAKKISRREFLSLSALTAGGALLAACGAASGSTQPATPAAAPAAAAATAPAAGATAAPAAAPAAAGPGTLRVMVRRSASITRLDAIRWGQPDVSQHLFDSLTRYDVDGKLQGRLAESWELVDPTTWRFKLRQGVKFQNGEDWNAEALKYNVEMYSKLDPP